MSLHIVLGYASPHKGAKPFLVYAGDSGSEAQSSKASAPHAARLEEFHHVSGLKKNNPGFDPAATPPDATALSVRISELEAQLAEAQSKPRKSGKP